MSKTNLFRLVLLIVFIVWMVKFERWNDRRFERINKALLNDMVLRGRVLNIKTSNNHAFGILLLKVDSVKKGRFIDTLLKEGIYPYKIKDGKAEVYAAIPDGIQVNDDVTVDSDKKTVFYNYIKQNERYEGGLNIVTSYADINYVKDNSLLK